MTTEATTPLRQRMIEDMISRKLCAHTQRGHIYSCKRFAAFLKRSPETATCEDICLHLQPQAHHDRSAVSVSRDAAAARPCCRDLSHPRAREDSAGDEPRRDAPATGRRQQAQSPG